MQGHEGGCLPLQFVLGMWNCVFFSPTQLLKIDRTSALPASPCHVMHCHMALLMQLKISTTVFLVMTD